MNTYAHVLPTLLGDATAGMDDLLGGTGGGAWLWPPMPG